MAAGVVVNTKTGYGKVVREKPILLPNEYYLEKEKFTFYNQTRKTKTNKKSL